MALGTPTRPLSHNQPSINNQIFDKSYTNLKSILCPSLLSSSISNPIASNQIKIKFHLWGFGVLGFWGFLYFCCFSIISFCCSKCGLPMSSVLGCQWVIVRAIHIFVALEEEFDLCESVSKLNCWWSCCVYILYRHCLFYSWRCQLDSETFLIFFVYYESGRDYLDEPLKRAQST